MKQRFWQLAAAGVGAASVLVPASAALATDYPDSGSTTTVNEDPGLSSTARTRGTDVAGETRVQGELPFTGGDVAALAAIGGGAVAIGGLLVVQNRKRRTGEHPLAESV